jgi:hypothetical protein
MTETEFDAACDAGLDALAKEITAAMPGVEACLVPAGLMVLWSENGEGVVIPSPVYRENAHPVMPPLQQVIDKLMALAPVAGRT